MTVEIVASTALCLFSILIHVLALFGCAKTPCGLFCRYLALKCYCRCCRNWRKKMERAAVQMQRDLEELEAEASSSDDDKNETELL